MLPFAFVEASGIREVETVFLLLLAFVILFALVAGKLKTPYPIVLVIAGLALGLIPGIPQVKLDPNIIFLVVLPPLLYAAAWNTSWHEFRSNLLNISMLAFGLVGFTVLGVAFAAPHFFPGFDWRIGFLLGAVVATTDAIAATSIAKSIGLPSRIVDILEGESLLNDATGLLALEFGVAMLVHGQTPTFMSGLLRLLWLTLGGIAVGLLIGYIAEGFERLVEYGAIEIILSLSIPYAAYLAAEGIHASRVLAVVACGLYVGRRSAELSSPKVRLQAAAVWESLTFTLNGLTFLLIGLQLPAVRAGIRDQDFRTLLLSGAIFTILLILLRLFWVFPEAYLATFIRRRLPGRQIPITSAKEIFVVGWTGMRGVIALAAALSLPTTLDDGSPFPKRSYIIFLTFSVILVTLVLQGLTLPWLIHSLGLAGASNLEDQENEARRGLLEAALAFLVQARQNDRPQLAGVYDHLSLHYQARLSELPSNDLAGHQEINLTMGRGTENCLAN